MKKLRGALAAYHVSFGDPKNHLDSGVGGKRMKARTVVVLVTMMALAFEGTFGGRKSLAQEPSRADQSAETFPPDINLESRSRMPRTTRDELTTEEDKQAYDHLVALAPGFGQPPVNGKFGGTETRLLIPPVADAYRTALTYLWTKSELDQKYVDLAIMVAARETNGEPEWVDWEDRAVKLNSREAIEIIRNKRDAKGLGEKEQTLIEFGREMFRGPKVSSKTFAHMERLFGKRGTLAVALIMGYYSNNSLLFRVYDQHLAKGLKRPFPDVLAMEAKEK
jgi:hypothetical protein